jgi:hypothetical protein
LKPRLLIFVIVAAVVCFNALLILWSFRHTGSVETAASLLPTGSGTLLHLPEGKRFVGDQLQFFTVSPEGEISATNAAWLSLYYTERKPFRLSGELWLNEPQGERVADLPDGFALFLREWDSLHRYAITTRSIDVKRRWQAGRRNNQISRAASFEPPEFSAWIRFSVEVSATNLSFVLGNQGAEIPGPLDIDGANKIVIAPGMKLKDVRLEIFEPAQ